MALTIYPTTNYDSLISLADATDYITKNSVHSATWTALEESMQEVYLRISTDRVLNVIDTELLEESDCLKKSVSMIAIKDVAFSISSAINPNTGLVSKEKVGDIERQYFHGYTDSQVKGLDRNPFPNSVIKCLNQYGANMVTTGGVRQATFLRS